MDTAVRKVTIFAERSASDSLIIEVFDTLTAIADDTGWVIDVEVDRTERFGSSAWLEGDVEVVDEYDSRLSELILTEIVEMELLP